MTGRLMTFEIRSSLKYLGILWAAVLVSSIFLGVAERGFGNLFSDGNMIASTLNVIFTFVFAASFVAMLVGTIIVIILRFYRGLLGEEGYLMHTLPVKTWQLITAKGVVAAGIVVVSILVSILALIISAGIYGAEVVQVFKDIGLAIRECPMSLLAGFELLVLMILWILTKVYEVYASMSIGQLAGKHRALLSIGAYVGIEVILDIIGIALISFIVKTGIGERIADSFTVLDNMDAFDTAAISAKAISLAQPEFIAILVAVIALLAVFHIITERLLATRLNLQ